ncbi:interferon gamma receptor 2 [Dicentrarchus labrax]|uniref:Fibronectin type-III domain-containing protein n=1 Tax=Dicentrarchus labrax TaxID=13489 RepID=A0A8P4KNU5_DICLA|nr:interferon gamma receptor 2 [Dicentrarchus labrax]XP_051258953.1 interferon gamma receptor 2 [Dicentrarchus labrax]XP_051258954.1 interferon gamma receptor 2 [Dicentrarchus labrax]XP_051258955.1 interferon gamma receptor 2 [Dicentrarchus labrax]XP_051258956.1 interferon gamma receptor 2 [Dicentrarchus labrax]XP_051258957.1 interferon gamma receptor 2 [Dicentrarchus labrax]XP_051258958.1 interferon gamma receptor 2 [Dicentrarchus labrax]XP_051258959.1 interferon gamma receptor 2 [Dicentrar
MLLIVFCVHLIVPVLSETPPLPPPQNVSTNNGLLTWTPAGEERDVTYTVQYKCIGDNSWSNVPACVRIPSTTCNVTFTKAKGDHGCVRLRVRAESRGLKSSLEEACSQPVDSCSPDVKMTAQPGSLTVHLGRNHDLAKEYADHAKHRVFYGKEGEPLTAYKDSLSSVTIYGLQEGQRYCVKLQYKVIDSLVGLPSCPKCELIPESKKSNQAHIIVPVVIVLVLVILTPAVAYVLIYHCKDFKKLLRPAENIPLFLTDSWFYTHHLVPISSPSEENWDVISRITTE